MPFRNLTQAGFIFLMLFSCKSPTYLPVQNGFTWLEGEWLGTGGEYGEVWHYVPLEDRMEGEALVQPKDQNPVYFEMEESSSGIFVAVNPYNDFPNQIEYRRSGNQMKATISSESRKKDFNFIRK